jgi:hypothetical protein
LFVHDLATDWLDPGNFPGCFRDDAGDSRQAVNAERRKSFKVGLDTGPSAAVRACDG